MSAQEHWKSVYGTKEPDQVSWFRPHLETSLAFIELGTSGSRSASIIDVRGGASTLVDDLVKLGYRNLTILDISQLALDVARKRLDKTTSETVRWLRADATQAELPSHSYDVWHDRPFFTFLNA